MATKKTAAVETKSTTSSTPVKTTVVVTPTAAKPVARTRAVRTSVKMVAPAASAKPATKAAIKKPAAVEPVVKKQKIKVKVVRDSFTMPQNEYQKIAQIKETCLEAGLQVKKSEVLRAGLKALAGMSPAQLKRALSGLEKIKTGRPKKH